MSLASATAPIAAAAALRTDVAQWRTGKDRGRPVVRPPGQFVPVALGRWLLEAIIADGAVSQVYRARPVDAAASAQTSRYALKRLRPVWHDEPLAVARLRQEAHVGRCVASRHVVSILTAHVHRDPFYLVMPFLAGQTVASLIKTQGRLQPPVALWIARQATEGLAALHTTGYLHGDVKPANLMITAAGHVSLIDLGCARQVDAEPTLEPLALVGTPHYLAPELFAGRYGDPRSDLYSLGIALFEMLTGRLPIRSSDLATIAAFKRDGVMPSVRVFAPEVHSTIADLVKWLTMREPLRRPQSARELVQSLIKLEILSLAQRISAQQPAVYAEGWPLPRG